MTTISYAKIEFCHRQDPYGTHQPVLYTLAINTMGPIIEFGCGNSSTDLLHEVCKQTNRLLISIDDDEAWLNKFRSKYLGDGYCEDNSGWHKFFYVPGKFDNWDPNHWIPFLNEFFSSYQATDFELCFIDQSP